MANVPKFGTFIGQTPTSYGIFRYIACVMKTRRITLAWDTQAQRERNEGRYTRERSAAPYHSARWARLARAFLDSHPLCEECGRKGIIKPAECVDHIEPWPICERYFYDTRNLQALCNRCNIEKGNRDKAKIRQWRETHGH